MTTLIRHPLDVKIEDLKTRLSQMAAAVPVLEQQAYRAMVRGDNSGTEVVRQHEAEMRQLNGELGESERQRAGQLTDLEKRRHKELTANLQQRANWTRGQTKAIREVIGALKDAFRKIDNHVGAVPAALMAHGDSVQGFPYACNDMARLIVADVEAVVGNGMPGQLANQFGDAMAEFDTWLAEVLTRVKSRSHAPEDATADALPPNEPEPETVTEPPAPPRELKGIYAEVADYARRHSETSESY